MRYFDNCKTAEELKSAYRKAAMKLHPDNGGDEEEFKIMQAEFSKMFDRIKNIHTTKDGETYEKTGEYATKETAEEFMDIINTVMRFDGVEIELCGSWLWFSGNTKEYKEELKNLGCKWSANKKMWYYQNDGKRKYHKKAWSIDQIRNTYGSQSFKKTEREKLEKTA
jgi:DnaJ-class molecular chaperone